MISGVAIKANTRSWCLMVLNMQSREKKMTVALLIGSVDGFSDY